MTRVGWLPVVIGLTGVFLVSIAVGAFVARQLRGQPSAPPVAVATATPAALKTASPSTTAATPTATTTTSPTLTATPDPTSTSAPTPTPVPATPTPVPATPTPALDSPTAGQFATDLAAAISRGDRPYLNDRLHPAVIERYSEGQCRRHIRNTFTGADVTWEVQDSAAEPWDYASDERTTTIDDAWTVTIRQPGADPEVRELHFAPAEGTWRWFTDCGDPA